MAETVANSTAALATLALVPQAAGLVPLQRALAGLCTLCTVQPVVDACINLVPLVHQHAPELVVVWLPDGAPTLPAALAPWAGELPFVLVVVAPVDAPTLHALVLAGMGAWLPTLDAEHLALVLAEARARSLREHTLRSHLLATSTQLDERKWVDRAKGLLMQARDLPEDQAFKLLRSSAMQAKLKLGEVARSVVGAAQHAEAVNRAGQLRMLSQRLLSLAAQRLARLPGAAERAALALQRAQGNIDFLAQLDLGPAAEPARAQVTAAWAALQSALQGRSSVAQLLQADLQAEALLQAAEQLTDVLQAQGARPVLGVVNLCGRQRMRAQRLTKDALLAALLQVQKPEPKPARINAQEATFESVLAVPSKQPAPQPQAATPQRAARMHETMDGFEQALLDIEAAPLTSPEIRAALAQSRVAWLALLRALRGPDVAAVANASEQLLRHLDELTEHCEHSLQVLLS